MTCSKAQTEDLYKNITIEPKNNELAFLHHTLPNYYPDLKHDSIIFSLFSIYNLPLAFKARVFIY